MEDGFSSYSSLYDTSSLLQFCNGKGGDRLPRPPSASSGVRAPRRGGDGGQRGEVSPGSGPAGGCRRRVRRLGPLSSAA